MRRSITVSSRLTTLTLVTDTTQEREGACSIFGPVSQGLITSQGTLGAQHTELLNSCLRNLEILQSKYYTGLDISKHDTEEALAEHSLSILDTTGIEVLD